MRPSPAVHHALSRLARYPSDGMAADVPALVAAVSAGCPEAGAALAPFAAFAADNSTEALEERFSATFDCTEERALEIGWHAFGENYSRGAYLVRLRELGRELGLDEGNELPDHLSNVLDVLGRCEQGVAADLAAGTVLPAVVKVHALLVACENPWASVLEAAQRVLELHAAPVAEGTQS